MNVEVFKLNYWCNLPFTKSRVVEFMVEAMPSSGWGYTSIGYTIDIKRERVYKNTIDQLRLFLTPQLLIVRCFCKVFKNNGLRFETFSNFVDPSQNLLKKNIVQDFNQKKKFI